MLNLHCKQAGVTLLEILIALVISVVIITGIIGVFSSALTNTQLILLKGRLDRDLQVVMDFIASDVQRAGYWGNATSSRTNIFQASDVDITVNGNCLMFTYDMNGDGVVNDNEQIGFSLKDGAIQYRAANTSFSCSSIPTDWTNLTDNKIMTVTAFTLRNTTVATDIDDIGSGTSTIDNRAISVTITAQLVNDSSVTKTISRTIKVYNDKYTP